ncbi:PA14 domain-containing protein [Chenggangzhangella methanolivorans]|uniref:PA14 domain-containing protein n=1 Tax=Chenggangzhangella methanolivorans TaxID=1437009 RepID=UPI0021BD2B91|nr:PA14 domain-containing protein [Chenggangzhangella methanolivorans]
MRYSATGLRPALRSIRSPRVSGTPTETGAFTASLIATRGDAVVSTDMSIVVDTRPTVGEGLLGEYFGGAALAGPVLAQRREALNFTFAETGPGSGVPGVFSARWRGSIRPTRGGATRFRVESDDGVRVWIAGKLIVDDWTPHSPSTREGQVDLAQGVDHPVFVEYFNSGGGGVLRLTQMRPGDNGFAPVPATELFAARAGSTANLAATRPATMSSVSNGGLASRAVDGNVNGAISANSIAHSGLQSQPWWQVDLGSSVPLDYVRIWKRTDCCADRAQDLTVFVAGFDMTSRTHASLVADPLVATRTFGASTINDFIDVPVSAAGRYVRVQKTTTPTSYLNLAEVQVFGLTSGAPTIATPAAQSTRTGTAVSLALTAADPDNDPLAFRATGLPPGLAIDAFRGMISGSPTTAGSYRPTVTVTDPIGLAASASFNWSVTGGQPRVTALEATPVQAGATKSYAPTIADGAGATFSWRFGDGAADTAFSASSATSHVFARPGVFSVVLVMRASDGAISTYAFDQAVFAVGAGTPGGTSSGGSAHQPSGAGLGRLWVVNRDNDTVSVIDLDGRRLLAEVPVGRKPWSLVLTGRNQIWVANRESASITVVDGATYQVLRTIALPAGSRPSDVATVGQWGDVAVTLEATGQIMLLGPLGENYGVGDAGPGPRRIAVNAARDKAYISRFITPPIRGESTAAPSAEAKPTKKKKKKNKKGDDKLAKSAAPSPAAAFGGEIRVIGLSGMVERTIVLGPSDAVDTEVSGRGVPNYLGAMAISPDGKTGWVPSKMDNVYRGMLRDGQPLNFQNTVRAIVSRVDLTTGLEDLSSRIDVDNAGVVSAVAIHPNGAYLFAALETTRTVAVLDPVGKRELMRVPVGQAPNALTLLPGGRWLVAHNLMDRSVSMIDLQPLLTNGDRRLAVASTIRTIGTEKLTATVLRGKQLFYDAVDTRLARDGYISCASCHDDGEGDGRVWDLTGFGEGLRNTISLQGHGGMAQGFLHWTGNFDEVQDFEKQIRDLAGGTGLMTEAAYLAGTRAQPLGDKKAGLSADLDALAAYVSSLTVTPRSPYAAANGGLTAAGQAGLAAFNRLQCGTCHAGTPYTISAGATALRSVGTIKPASGKRLGETLTRLDVPTLRGAWATAPYLHDGSAPTLQAAIKAHTTLAVPDADLDSLAAFVRELGPQ